MDEDGHSRRALLRASGAAVFGSAALAGCTEAGGGCEVEGADATVAVGPGGNVFRPESVSVPEGGTVGWCVESAGHNVSGVPEHSDEVSLPDGAEPFASYGDDKYAVLEIGDTYSHTFETAGAYTYVCIPHVSVGMVGSVEVG